jgi:hypothetical protein
LPDPRHRLYRPIPGERFHVLSTVVVGAFAWDVERCTRLPHQTEHKEPRDVKLRASRRQQLPTAYSPKMIRLVRHPFSLPVGRFQRRDAGERARPEARVRVSFTETVAAARAVDRRIAFPKPTDVHPRREARPRPSASAYLAGVDQ